MSGRRSVLIVALAIVVVVIAWRAHLRDSQVVTKTPHDKFSLVIYFHPGTTEEEVEDFRRSVLAARANEHANSPLVGEQPGESPPDFVEEYWRLAPDQAHGHWANAITFSKRATAEEVSSYEKRIKGDRRVENVYRDIAPDQVHA